MWFLSHLTLENNYIFKTFLFQNLVELSYLALFYFVDTKFNLPLLSGSVYFKFNTSSSCRFYKHY
jgi:hypothetical protein